MSENATARHAPMTPIDSVSKLDIETTSRQSATSTIRVGLIGAGAIGRHHARVLGEITGAQFVGICDVDPTAGAPLAQKMKVAFFGAAEQLIEKCDAVIVASPTCTHFEIASMALLRGKHVFVEKPLADTVERAKKLVSIAQASHSRCVVGHVERFNSVVRWFKQNLRPEDILTINITRVGPRPPRVKDVGIVIDLAVHDIDLVSYLSQSSIDHIHAVCKATNGPFEDVAQISLRTQSGAVCGINTNWLTPYKSRKIEIATSNAFYVGDLVSGSITRFQNNSELAKTYSVETFSPRGLEPLVEQTIAFLSLIRGEPQSDNATVMQACKTVELAAACLNKSKGDLNAD